MVEKSKIKEKVRELLFEIADLVPGHVNDNISLIGIGAIVSSREVVELLLALEEYAEEELECEFDWTSDSAMSSSNSIFRSVDALADHLYELQKN